MAVETEDASTTTSKSSLDGLSAEIDKAVDAVMEEQKVGSDGEAKADETADGKPGGGLPVEAEAEAGGDEDVDPRGETDPVAEDPGDRSKADDEVDDKAPETPKPDDKAPKPSISDELTERAIRAGIPLSEVKQYPSEALLSAMCDRVESPAGSGDGGQANADSSGNGAGDLLSSIPDLDPEEYSDELVAGFKAMKETIKQQQETINGLRGDRSTDWFEAQVAGMEGIEETLKKDPSKVPGLRAKFDVLEAGYKAADQKVERRAVFDEAAKLVLGDELEAARTKAKETNLEKRSGQQISRPSGRRPKPKGDAFDEVAAELDRKYFSKT